MPGQRQIVWQEIKGITNGEANEMLFVANSFRFPLWTPGASVDHVGGPQQLFVNFLDGEKV